MVSINFPDLPSWLWVCVLGFGIVFLLSNPIGWTVMGAGLALGGVYFLIDIIRKIT